MRRTVCLLAAAAVLASSPATDLPALTAKPQFDAAPIELTRNRAAHHKRHHKRRHAATTAIGGAAAGGLFWPLEVAKPDVDDPACALVGCAPGWTLGPLAWGLYGVGFSDPLGLSR
jgi:hypothetical protein